MTITHLYKFSITIIVFLFLNLIFTPELFNQDLTKMKLVYKVPGMEKVEKHKDITYKKTDQRELKMDIYIPPGLSKEKNVPAVIFIHGGYLSPGENPKDWGVYTSYGELIAASGFIGVTFNHRYYGWDKTNFSNAYSDVFDAIKYVREHAKEYQIDPDLICIWGFSGGGPFLSVALREKLDYIRCIISYYAILDLTPISENSNSHLDPKLIKMYSPVNYLDENIDLPSIFIARAALDNAGINKSVENFMLRAFNLNAKMIVINHPIGRHGFDILDDDEYSREIISNTITFIKTNIIKKESQEKQIEKLLPKVSSFLLKGDIEKVRAAYKNMFESKKLNPYEQLLLDRLFSERSLNHSGYGLISSGKKKEAIELFRWIVELYPDSPNAFDSLSEGYELDNQPQLAIENAEKALKLLETRTDLSENQKKTISNGSKTRIEKLKK